MIYGLYMSAMGVVTNSRRQDVIANNLANTETVGFKRDLTAFYEQRTEAAKRGRPADSNKVLEGIGGGLAGAPTFLDMTQGSIETSATSTDVAINGPGFFAVSGNGQTLLTRDGRFSIDKDGYLVTAVGGRKVLNDQLQPISLGQGQIAVNLDGAITQNGQLAGNIGLFDVPKPAMLKKSGGNLLDYPELKKSLKPAAGEIRGGALEHSNADPTSELAALMDAQRQLEANANMIRYQDQTLGRLVNDVGRIG